MSDCRCKIKEILLAATWTLIVTHIRKDAHHRGKSEGALACELQYQPHWGLWADLLISVQGVNESSSEGWGTVHPACPSLLPVLAMNMELFCGWELAYVFCLISRPHSHFKGRSTRGLDFLICLATESTTCMWDQLPVRADNPTASKYTYPPPPHLVLPLHCPSLCPLLRWCCLEPDWSKLGLELHPIPDCSDYENWDVYNVPSKKTVATVRGVIF